MTHPKVRKLEDALEKAKRAKPHRDVRTGQPVFGGGLMDSVSKITRKEK